jgi:hypothetical protein
MYLTGNKGERSMRNLCTFMLTFALVLAGAASLGHAEETLVLYPWVSADQVRHITTDRAEETLVLYHWVSADQVRHITTDLADVPAEHANAMVTGTLDDMANTSPGVTRMLVPISARALAEVLEHFEYVQTPLKEE